MILNTLCTLTQGDVLDNIPKRVVSEFAKSECNTTHTLFYYILYSFVFIVSERRQFLGTHYSTILVNRKSFTT